MHIFVSLKPLSPVRWHEAFPEAETVRTPSDAARWLDQRESAQADTGAVMWLDFSGLDPVQRQLWLSQARALDIPLVVLAAVPSDEEAARVFTEGARGYCHVLAAPELLQQVALVVGHGGYWVGGHYIDKLLQMTTGALGQGSPTPSPVIDQLTERERMVAKEVARGATNKEIAASLDITERTVKAHLASIFSKTGARDRIQLVLMLNQFSMQTA